MQQFVTSFCVSDNWALLQNNTPSLSAGIFSSKLFAFGEETPCVVDGVILSVCYIVFIVLCAMRIGQLNSKEGKLYTYKNKAYPCLQSICAFGVFVLELLSVVKFFIPSLNDYYGDVYAVGSSIAPFQVQQDHTFRARMFVFRPSVAVLAPLHGV